MGLFDFFKDGDNYEGAHDSRRSSARKPAVFDVSKFDSNAELIAWMEKNKVILLSEDEGLVVYSNDRGENFLQLYTSTTEAKSENLNEYVEVTGADLRDLLDEMPDISHFVLNPASSNILLRREEMLGKDDLTVSKPVEREAVLPEEAAVSETSSLTDASDLSESEPELISESASFESVSENVSESIMEAESDESESENVSESEIIQNEEKEVKTIMNLEAAATIPQSIITTTLSLAAAGVQKFYLAQENQGDFSSLFFLAATDQEIDLGDELIGVKSCWKDGSEIAVALEDDKFLIFDKSAAEELAENPLSEGALLYYFKNHPVIYSLPVQKGETGSAELLAFSDFSQIPDLFLNAFDSFEMASLEQFNAFLLSDEGRRVDTVHLNPFSSSLFMKPEAFKPAVAAAQAAVSNELTIDSADKKAVISEVLKVLKDFDIANIALSADDHVSVTFRKKEDAAVAKQILRMKTDLKV